MLFSRVVWAERNSDELEQVTRSWYQNYYIDIVCFDS